MCTLCGVFVHAPSRPRSRRLIPTLHCECTLRLCLSRGDERGHVHPTLCRWEGLSSFSCILAEGCYNSGHVNSARNSTEWVLTNPSRVDGWGVHLGNIFPVYAGADR